ncbi:MAG: RNA polymerase sigma factor [Bacteroides sp.]|nr:RNA polymerase sigma factor [Roseburia sp.]MCM1346031.1 RNA polymerase sigma factor [Bacteroides sp.]MCM1420192.1 RNA polymerase sigma factor [Bacteroides sp.]
MSSKLSNIPTAICRNFSTLFGEERKDMFRYACYKIGNAEDAEDMLQDVYLTLHDKLRGGTDICNLRGYLYRCLSNTCTDYLRRRQGMKTVSIEQADGICNPETENFEQEYRRISTLLSAIPEEQAEVIRMRIHSDKSFVEIAEILEISVSTVKSRFQYGIEKIRKGLAK